MSPRGDAGDTDRTVRERYDAYSTANPRPRGRTALKVPVLSDAAERMVGMAAGFGIGVLLLVLAVTAGVAAASWAGVERSGAVVGYTIVTFFLTLAGLGAILGTWNHVFRVIPGEVEEH